MSEHNAPPMDYAPAGPPDPSVPRTLLCLAAPVIASMISRTVMGFVDFVMVSRLGTDAQAAIMPAGILLFCVISLGMGTVTSVNTFVSQSLGRGRRDECAAYAWQGLHVSWVMGVFMLPCWFLIDPALQWLPCQDEVRKLQGEYMRIGILGIGPSVAAVVLANFFTGIHRPKLGLLAALISNAFNVFANWVLIFGHMGFPRMGIRGAAIATLAASCLNAGILLAWMLSPKYAREFRSWRMWRPSLRRLRGMLAVGFPTGLQFLADIVSWAIFVNFLVARFGTKQLAANNIAFQWLHVSFMPAVGLGIALTSAVGKAIGQKRIDLAHSYIRWGLLFTIGYMGTAGAIYAIFRRPLVACLNDDPEVVVCGAKLMLLCAAFQIFDAMAITFIAALRGAGDTRGPAAITIVAAAGVFLGGAWLAVTFFPQWESIGPWVMATVYIMIVGLAMWARYRFGSWEKIKLFADDDKAHA